ncbi:MAG TPA: DNA gyrase subunit A, partial [Bacteroidales bacterium]|nr:DNA gyrase subunit A [Bacteroidales bacterium]
KKSARIVGEVLGKYHPHGDSSVYDAMVRMAQDWSLRYPLVDGQGNFGSIDGDSPAAMRYTEAKLKRIAEETLSDIEKETVDFQPNFDDTLQEPTVLPTRIPTLLVNGASGIAVGMATNMPPHNLSEAVDAIIAYIDDPEITTEGLMHYIKGPDFPTGGIIYGEQGIREAYETGRGRIVVRAKTEVELTHSGRECIVVTEIPYMVNKAEMIKRIADLINEKKLEGISYINDESDRTGMRVVIILKKEMPANIVLNHLYKHSQLQTSFNVNNIALVKGRPKTLALKEIIDSFVKHRHDIVVRRAKYDLDQAEKRAHILEGLIIASDNIDEVIAIIRSSQNTDIARERLMERFGLTDIQARAIVEMRLRQLTGLEQDKLHAEYEEIKKLIEYLNQVLADEKLQMQIIKDELLEVKDKFGDKRRTQIVPAAGEFNPEDFYADDEMVITISHMGYIKRTPLTEFRRQNRGGTGKRGSTTREEDFIEHMYVATMHNTMLFFTRNGKCHWQKVYDLPEGTRNSKGRAIQNVINIEPDDSVRAFINVKTIDDSDYINNNFIVLCTRKGVIKKTSLEAYSRPRANGINAITVREGDELLEARMTNGSHEIMLAVRSGRAVRFKEATVRPMGRTASGVRGITLSGDDDVVIGMITVENEAADVLVVSENGFGKRSAISDYRITNRGGKGVKTINITDKTGKLIALKDVNDQYDLLIITQNGNILRTPVNELRVMGRATQGVKLIDIKENDSIASVAYVEVNEDDNEPGIDIEEQSADSAE